MNEYDVNIRLNELTVSAIDNFVLNDFNGAVRDLKAAEMIDPLNPEVLHNLAVCYARMGLFRSAVDYCARLLDGKQGYVETASVKKMLAFSQIGLGLYDEGIAVVDDLLNLHPRDETALSIKGFALEKSGRAKEALKIYRQILAINSKNSGALNSAAFIISEHGGDIDEAFRMISSALKIKPVSGAFLDTLGYVLMKNGDYARAKSAYKKALKILPGNKEIMRHIAALKNI